MSRKKPHDHANAELNRAKHLRRRRRVSFETLERRDLLAAEIFGTNPLQPFDVSRDGNVSPIDALRVINAVARAGGNTADPANNVGNFIDVSGDGQGSVLDALRVINALGRAAPLIAATLPVDSAPEGDAGLTLDLRTNSYAIDLTVSVADLADEAVRFRIGGESADFTEITNRFSENAAQLTAEDIDNLFGQPLPDGDHPITVQIGEDGNQIDFVLTVDRQAATPSTDVETTERVAPESIDVMFDEPIVAGNIAASNFLLKVDGGSQSGQPIEITRVAVNDASNVQVGFAEKLLEQAYIFETTVPIFDLAGNALPAQTLLSEFVVAVPTGLSQVSPAGGEEMVSLTRETIIRFDEPIDPATVNEDSFYLFANSQRVPGTIRVSSTERFATFFYDTPLPASTAVRIMVDGSQIMGQDGLPLDANSDNEPGGMGSFDFRTLPLSLIAGTSVWGYIFDSYNTVPQETAAIEVPAGDPEFDPTGTGQQSIPFVRAEFFAGTGDSTANPRLHPNRVTSFIDASMVYGSDEVRARALRTIDGTGHLKLTPDGRLPLNNEEYFPDGTLANDNNGPFPDDQLPVAGDVRAAEIPGLTVLHTLLAREHNRKADEVKAAHPNWSDELIYQSARKWVSAIIQNISYQEYLPTLLGPSALPAFTGYDPNVDPSITTLFSTAAFRTGHSQQTTEVLRLDDTGASLPGGPLSLRDSFFNPNPVVADGIDAYLRGLMAQVAEEVDTQVVSDLRNFLFGAPGQGGMDLAAIAIQRGRDMGLPSYVEARSQFGLTAVTDFSQITSDAPLANALQQVYQTVDKVDLWVGGLAEEHVAGGSVGPLFAAIIQDQFLRSRNGDRFWFENGQFSDSDLTDIRNTTMASLIQRNTTITNLSGNVFINGTAPSGPAAGGTAGSVSEFRTYNGSDNNYTDSHLGQTHQPVLNGDTVGYGDGKSTIGGTDRPDARSISNQIFDQQNSVASAIGLNSLSVVWGQFLTHDIVLTPTQSADGTNIPVINATISLDALPDIKATTDKFGFFELTSVDGLPAPEFFVHIDGSTAINAPSGTAYATLGKPFHSIPGQPTQLAMNHTPFDIYLPPMSMGDIVELNRNADTEVGFGPGAQEQIRAMFPDDPDKAQMIIDTMKVTYPAGSAQNENGELATQATIVPVPPDRLPAPLPPGLDPSLVISVQAGTSSGFNLAGGSTNFDTPAPVVFPNDQGRPIGDRVEIFSFDHDAGAWRPIGTATIVDAGNGQTVAVGDAGVGILAPGWHFIEDGGNWAQGGDPTCTADCKDIRINTPEARLLTVGTNDTISITFTAPTARRTKHDPPDDTWLSYSFVPNEAFRLIYEIIDKPSSLTGHARDGETITFRARLRDQTSLLDYLNDGRAFDQDILFGARLDVISITYQNGKRTGEKRTLLPFVYADFSDDKVDDELKFRDVSPIANAATKRELALIDVSDEWLEILGTNFEWKQRGPGAAPFSKATKPAIHGELEFHPFGVTDYNAGLVIQGETAQGSFTAGPVSLLGRGTPASTIEINTTSLTEVATAMNWRPGDPAALAFAYEEYTTLIYAAFPTVEVALGSTGAPRTVDVQFRPNPGTDLLGDGETSPGGLDHTGVIPLFDELDAGQIGLAQSAFRFHELFNFEGGAVSEIKLNDRDYLVNVAKVNDPISNVEFLDTIANTVAHESGHAFGLLHTNWILGRPEVDFMGFSTQTSTFYEVSSVSRLAILAGTDGDITSTALNQLMRHIRYGLVTNYDCTVFGGRKCIPFVPNNTFDAPTGPILDLLGFPELDPVLDGISLDAAAVGNDAMTPFILRNNGDASFQLQSVTAAGDTAISVSNIADAVTVEPGGSIEIPVVFAPQQVGQHAAEIEIVTDTGLSNTETPGVFRFDVSAQAVPAGRQLTLRMLGKNNLGPVQLGDVSEDAILVLSNDAAEPVTIEAVRSVSLDEEFEVHFDATGTVLKSLETLEIPVRFTPTDTGLRRGILEVRTAEGDVLTVGVVGTGVPVGGAIDAVWGNDYLWLESSGLAQNLKTTSAGTFSVFLPDNEPFDALFFDPDSGYVASTTGVAGPTGGSTDLGSPLIFAPSLAPDTDFDGLPDDIELAIGTDLTKVDTDGDGRSDFSEIEQGQDPLSGLSIPTGTVGSLALIGESHQVAVTATAISKYGYVATGSHGLAVVDLSEFDNPIILGQLDLNGDARDVAIDGLSSVAMIAAGEGGLHFVDVSDPMLPILTRTAAVNATQIELIDGVAYVAVGKRIHGYDPISGDLFSSLIVPNTAEIVGLAHEGNMLYAMDADRKLHVLEISTFRIDKLGEVTLPQGRGRLSVSNGVVYAAAINSYERGGFVTVDVSDPANPVVVSGSDVVLPFVAPGTDVVANGSGLGLSVGSQNGQHLVDVMDLSDPDDTNNLLTRFNLPAVPRSVTIASGIGYVADGTGGLIVVNYVPFDNLGLAPVVTATGPAGTIVQEGSVVPIRVSVTDDVQVRDVELLMNGLVVARDVSAPFDLRAVTPALDSGDTEVSFQVRATDTGGNAGLSDVLTYTLTPDITPPEIIGSSPADNGAGFRVQAITLRFSEPMDSARLALAGFTLTNLGADFLPEGGDDTTVALDRVEALSPQRIVVYTKQTLPDGRYHLTVDSNVLADVAGNEVTDPVGITFASFNLDEQNAVAWISDSDGSWNDAANWSTGEVPGPDDAVVIDRKIRNPLVSLPSGNVSVRSLVSREEFVMNGGSLTVSEPSEIQARFEIRNGSRLTVDGRGALFTVNGDATIDGGQFTATNGGLISLPTATSFTNTRGDLSWTIESGGLLSLPNVTTVTNTTSIRKAFKINALSGGMIDLSGVTEFIDPGTGDSASARGRTWNITVDGAGSLIDVSDLTLLQDSTSRDDPTNGAHFFEGRSSLVVRNGGEFRSPNLNDVNALDLRLDDTSVMPTAQLETFRDGVLQVSGTERAFGSLVDGTSTFFTVSGIPQAFPNLQLVSGGGVTVQESGAATLSSLTNAQNASVTVRSGGTTKMPQLTDIDGMNVAVSDGTTLSLPSATSYSNTRGNVTWTVSGNGSRFDLPNVTSVTNTTSIQRAFNINALTGGMIDLSAVTEFIDPSSSGTKGRTWNITIDGAGSLIDVSSLTSLQDATSTDDPTNGAHFFEGRSSLLIRNEGEFRSPVLTDVNAFDLRLDENSVIPITQLEVFTDGVLQATTADRTFSSLSNADASFITIADASVSFPVLTSLRNGNIVVQGDDTTAASFPLLSNIDGVRFVVQDDQVLSIPSATSFTNTRGNLTWTIESGGRLSLPNVTSFTNTASIQRAFNINALAGGMIDLSAVTEFIDPSSSGTKGRTWNITVDGAGSLIDLSSLTSLQDATSTDDPTNGAHFFEGRSSLVIRNGGEFRSPVLTDVKAFDLRLDENSVIPITQLEVFTDGVLQATTADRTFSSLSNADASFITIADASVSFPALTSLRNGNIVVQGDETTAASFPLLSNIDGVRFVVQDDQVLSLPSATSFTNTRGNLTWTIESGGRLSLPNVTSVTNTTSIQRAFNINALTGGMIDLSAVTEFIDPSSGGTKGRTWNITVDGAGSLIDLSSLTSLQDATSADDPTNGAHFFEGRSTLIAENEGELRFGAMFPAIHNFAITLDQGGQIAGTLDVLASSSLAGGGGRIVGSLINRGSFSPGSSAGGFVIQGNFTQTDTGTTRIDLNGVEPGTEYDQISISGTATLDGTLAVSMPSSFEPILGFEFEILSFAARAGDFAIFTGLSLEDGRQLLAFYESSVLLLTVTST